jgi:3-oxoacyl-[acyl-carrier-protein] synthase II
VVTGLGAVTPLGLTVEDFWNGLVSGKSGIDYITLFDATSYPVKIAAEVKGFDPTLYMDEKRADRTGRCTQFAIAAAKMAMNAAKLDMTREQSERVGVIIATSGMVSTLIDHADTIKSRPKRIDPLFIPKMAPSMVTSQLALDIGARGPNTSINSACASGSDAIGLAMNHILLGNADVIIAGGTEANINPVAIATMARVGALSLEPDPKKASRPFDLNRSGFVYGEGAGILILESLEHALNRDAPILAELAGVGWSFDAYNDTAPDPNIEALAIKAALNNAGLLPQHTDYINAHGTSTKLNDAAETQAIKMVFGDHAYRVPISSNKSMIGHLACAAGAVEAVAAVMTIREGIIPPTINLETPDPECDLDYVPNKARRRAVNTCLSNSFGMGGQNCCLVFKKFSR